MGTVLSEDRPRWLKKPNFVTFSEVTKNAKKRKIMCFMLYSTTIFQV